MEYSEERETRRDPDRTTEHYSEVAVKLVKYIPALKNKPAQTSALADLIAGRIGVHKLTDRLVKKAKDIAEQLK